MALQVSSDAQLVFFTKVFGLHAPTTERAKALLGHGVTFEISLYNVRAFLHGKAFPPVTMTIGSSALMKGTVEPTVAAQNKHLIEEWVAALYQKLGTPPVKPAPVVSTKLTVFGIQPGDYPPNIIVLIKAIRAVTGEGLAFSKAKAEQVLAGANVELDITQAAHTAVQTLIAAGVTVTGGVAVPPVAAKKPVDAVIDLKQAQALGQKVHGTSHGSVYYCIAISESVKLAARLYKSGSVSIRAEWTDNPTTELKKLEESGVNMKSGYGSIHFDAGDVPIQRVVGAFLVGTGIQWKAAVMNGAELVIGEQ